MGHSMSDPGNYRTRAEIEKHQERDPIKLFIESLKTNSVIGDDDLAQIEAQVKEDVDSQSGLPKRVPYPTKASCTTDIYANPL